MCRFLETKWECSHAIRTKVDFCLPSKEGLPCTKSETSFKEENGRCNNCKVGDTKGTEGEASKEAEGRGLEKWLNPQSRDDLVFRTSKKWMQKCEDRRRMNAEGEKMTEKTAEPHIRTDSPGEDDM